MITRNDNMTVTIPMEQFDKMEAEIKNLREKVSRNEITLTIDHGKKHYWMFHSDKYVYTYPSIYLNSGAEISEEIKKALAEVKKEWSGNEEHNNKTMQDYMEAVKKEESKVNKIAEEFGTKQFELDNKITSFNDHILEIDSHNGFLKTLVIGKMDKYYYRRYLA